MDNSSYGAHACMLGARFGVCATEDGHLTHLSSHGCMAGNFTQACHRTNLTFARRGPDIPGDLFRRSRNGKKMEGRLSGGRKSDRTNPDRPDRTSSARPFPDRSAMAKAGPSGAPSPRSSSQAVGRVVKTVAGRAPKSSQAARQNRRRPRAKRDAARQVATQKAYGQTGLNVREPSRKKN